MKFTPLGDTAVVVELGRKPDRATLRRVQWFARSLERDPPPGLIAVVPAFATVTVFYDPVRVAESARAAERPEENPFAAVCAALQGRKARAGKKDQPAGRTVAIPVCYDGEFGPDLKEVAAHTGLAPEEVIRLHSAGDYLVHALGFAPGFPYLGGLPEPLHTPRRTEPRLAVPAGSVGIGGEQTGIYPLATPGGWQLIGRTPLTLFAAGRNPPALLAVGDRVKFRRITREEFAAWTDEPEDGQPDRITKKAVS